MQAESTNAWFIYSLGGGLGHLNRSLCLARAAIRRNIKCTLLSNSEHIDFVRSTQTWQVEFAPYINLVALPASLEAGAVREFVRDTMGNFPAGTFVVDTFPRGILGELVQILPGLGKEKCVLIARDLNAEYVKKFDIISFVNQHYGLVIDPGDHSSSDLQQHCVRTEMWVTRNAEELRTSADVYTELGLKTVDNLLVLSCTGNEQEQDGFLNLIDPIKTAFPDLSIAAMVPASSVATGKNDEFAASTRSTAQRWGSIEHRISNWPGIDYVAAASVVIGAAGYNLVADCNATKTPLISIPQSKIYDRQDLRAKNLSTIVASTFGDIHRGIANALSGQKHVTPDYVNGADTACDLILQFRNG